jgi:hypothetical protein
MNASDSVLPPPAAERPALRLLERPLRTRSAAASTTRTPQRQPSPAVAWRQAMQRWVQVWRD